LAGPFWQTILFAPHQQIALPIPFPWRLHLSGLKPVDALQQVAGITLMFGVPMLYGYALYWLRKHDKRDVPAILALGAIAAGIPYLHEGFSRAEFGHVAQAVLPAVLLLAALLQYKRAAFGYVAGAFGIVVLLAWLPMEPALLYNRMELNYPGATAVTKIDGHDYTLPTAQARTIEAVRAAYDKCRPHGFLAAPYYPGFYALLHARAPMWDAYVLYPRAPEFQQEQIAKLGDVSLVLLNRAAAVDGDPARSFASTNPLIMEYIDAHFAQVGDKLPDGGEIWARGDCRAALEK